MTSPAIKLAKECGINATFVCGNPDECPDDDKCCHHSIPQGRWIKDGMIERFYAKAQAQALRDAAEKFDEDPAPWREPNVFLRRMAGDLEAGK